MMKRIFLTGSVLATVLSGFAVTFTPNPSDLGDLDHHDATSWGINWTLPAGQEITGATLTIKNIWDWRVENDKLFIHLLDDPKLGVKSHLDNSNDNVISDYFSGKGVLLMTFSDPVGGHSRNCDLVYQFTPANLVTLQNYLSDPHSSYNGSFGFGFDPDCHYFNDGVTFEIQTSRVPDGGSTIAMFGLGLMALPALRRVKRA